MKKLIFLVLPLLMACRVIVDPLTFGDYYVTNSTTKPVVISATTHGKVPATLLISLLAAGEKAHVYVFAEGSGGHPMPSNAFEDFAVYSESETPANVIYSGINNNDWVAEGVTSEGHYVYHLTIH